jgi:toxin-antitoxin system PIN domain toxin
LIAIDTNILVYAHRVESAFHEAARAAITSALESGTPFALPWPCVHEFLSTVTNPRIANGPTPVALAVEQMGEMLRSDLVALLSEASGHYATLSQLLLAANVMGPLVHDARIAAICIDNGITELWTADRDFRRFPGLRLRNPLV